jgi:EmrB/QacA subfamily drug resistance transporter
MTDSQRRSGLAGRAAWITGQRAVATVYTVSMFMSIMDTQIVNVALATLSRHFGATPAQVGWTITGYLLALAASIPVSGWLGERYGTRRIYLLAVAIFVIASGLCAASASLPQLVATRVLQGVGGGLMIPTGITMLYRAYPPERRVHISRLITRVAVIAPATAPIIGGLLISGLSWRWIFLVNLPFGAAVLAFGVRFLAPEDVPGQAPPFDLPGFLLAGGGLAALLYGFTQGPADGWGSPIVLVPALGGAAALAAFAVHGLHAPQPLLRLSLLREPLFRGCCEMIGCSTTAFFGSLVFTALYLQEGRGYSAIVSGSTTFLEAIAIGLSSQIVARLYPRVGPRRLMTAGFCGLVGVNCLLATLGAHTSLWVVRGLMVAIGIAVSYVMLPLQAAGFARISPAETGHAAAIFTTAQRAGSASGVALLSTVLALGAHNRVRAPVHAFHAVYLTAAVVALFGLTRAWRIRDADAAETMAGTSADAELTAA